MAAAFGMSRGRLGSTLRSLAPLRCWCWIRQFAVHFLALTPVPQGTVDANSTCPTNSKQVLVIFETVFILVAVLMTAAIALTRIPRAVANIRRVVARLQTRKDDR